MREPSFQNGELCIGLAVMLFVHCVAADGESRKPLPPKKRKKEDEPVALAKKLKVIFLFFAWTLSESMYTGESVF